MEPGVRLSGDSICYTSEKNVASMQLEVTAITLYNSPPTYHPGSLIAVNNNYICYVVKGNQILSQFLRL